MDKTEEQAWREDILERLIEAGSAGLDYSPGDPLAKDAVKLIKNLLLHLQENMNEVKALKEREDRLTQEVTRLTNALKIERHV